MITNSEETISFIKNLEKLTAANSIPGWLAERHSQHMSRIREIGWPKAKDEEWKYTNIAPILKSSFEPPSQAQLNEVENFKHFCRNDEIRIVFVNGTFNKDLSALDKLPEDVIITNLSDAFAKYDKQIQQTLKKFNTDKSTVFLSLNEALSREGAYIEVLDKAIVEKFIHVVHVTSGDEQIISLPRTVISLGKSSEATVLESHVAFNDNSVYLVDALTDIALSENAVLHYCKAQKESFKAFHIGNTRVRQERNSNFDSFSLMVGGAITRNDLDISIDGEGANATLNGLYSTNGDQHVDNHSAVDHRVPNCTSNQLYKGILNGSSRAVFNGKIFVRSIAQKTNSYQLNKNLILGKDARVDTKPQLEIDADDVKCTHGATIGQLNEDEIFYIQSRCIPRREAVKMLSKGFVNDILVTIQNETIREKFTLLLEPTFAAL